MPSARALVSPPCKNAATAGEKALSGGSDGDEAAEDTLHFVGHNDTVASLALRYGVPPQELRRANRLASDHLLAARRTVVIPGAYYKGGVSLSPRPVEVGSCCRLLSLPILLALCVPTVVSLFAH